VRRRVKDFQHHLLIVSRGGGALAGRVSALYMHLAPGGIEPLHNAALPQNDFGRRRGQNTGNVA
jgi:hypothetical protein